MLPIDNCDFLYFTRLPSDTDTSPVSKGELDTSYNVA